MYSSSGKLSLAITLMLSSIALLVAFQYFWLTKVYEEQQNLLEKEAGQLFKDALFILQDSIIQSKVKASGSWEANTIGTRQKFKIATTTQTFDMPAPPGAVFYKHDSLKVFRHDAVNKSNISIFYTSDDSFRVDQQLSMVVMGAQKIENDPLKQITVTLGGDSLQIADIRRYFSSAIDKAGIELPFHLLQGRIGDTIVAPQTNVITTAFIPAGFPPHTTYAAVLEDYRPYLLRKVAPQALFSLFLVGLTTLSFWFIFRSLRQQQRLTALKNDFISNVTHELKTPIATVSVAIEALRDFNALDNPQLTREYLDISKNELSRLTMLVDKVLKIAMFEQKELELKRESIDLKDLLTQVLTSMRLQFEQNRATVNFHQQGDSFQLEGDRTHLVSVAYNLIDNALKYSPESPQIDVALAEEASEIRLEVRDKGVGIAPEYRGRIFEKFFRVPNGDVHDVKGHGLGLSYVAEVVHKHGGRIEVSGDPGGGSCFTVYLQKENGQAN